MNESLSGRRIRDIRLAMGLSQVELAALLDVSNVTINRWEHEKSTPQASMRERLLQAESLGMAAFAPRSPQVTAQYPVSASRALIGRDAELRRADSLVVAGSVVTILGPGGVGKTRLAIETGRVVASRFSDGVRFVDLTTIGSDEPVGDAVIDAVVRVLGVRERGGRSAAGELKQRLAVSAMLLILDNCEHVAEACERFISEYLGHDSRSALLATSRVPIGENGRTLELSPLSIEAAAKLFADRVEVQTAQAIDQEDHAAIEELCRRLDGLPLAIELAAARSHVLSIGQILDRIDRRFELLRKEDNRTARQRTLEATIGWGYDLLAPAEAALFRRLSVFPGWFDLDAVEAISPGGMVLDALDGLVRQSMVVVRRDAGAKQQRYRLLESLAVYARQMLMTADRDEVSERFVSYYAELVSATSSRLRGPEQLAALATIDREYDNCVAALDMLIGQGDGERAVSLATSLWSWWHRRGMARQGCLWLKRGLGLMETGTSRSGLIGGLNAYGLLAWYGGQLEVAASSLERAAMLAQEQDDKRGYAQARDNLGLIHLGRRDVAAARAAHEEAFAIWRSMGAKEGMASSRLSLGNIANTVGDYAGAERDYHEAWALVSGLGDLTSEAGILGNLGELSTRMGAMGRANDYLMRALELTRQLDDPSRIGINLVNLAEVKVTLGAYAEAQALADEAIGRFAEIGHASYLASAHFLRGSAYAGLGHHGEALADLRASLREYLSDSDWADAIYAVEAIGTLLLAGGDAGQAARLFGGCERVRSEDGIVDYPLLDRDGTIALLHHTFPADALEDAWAGGRELPREMLVAEATTIGQAFRGASVAIYRLSVSPASGTSNTVGVLTPRQREVIVLVAQGLSNREIAEELAISDRTVERHLTAIFGILDVDRRSAAVAAAFARGIVAPPRS